MSATPHSIEDYITQTLSAEERAVNQASQSLSARVNARLLAKRAKLKRALARDKKMTAIRIAHDLMEDDSEDEDIESLYLFLLERVGVPVREPYFALSMQPFVRSLSAIAALVPVAMLAVSFWSLNENESLKTADIAACVSASAVLSIPVFDMLIATIYNRLNHFRLMD